MKSIPASVAIIGVATLLAAAIATPVTALAAGWSAPAAHFERGDARVVLVSSETSGPNRYTRERVPFGYGGARLEHHFGMHPDDPERPRHRHYYPYVWGGYGFSAPYFVKRSEYSRPEYEQQPYGRAQKYRWGRDYKRKDQWEDGRW